MVVASITVERGGQPPRSSFGASVRAAARLTIQLLEKAFGVESARRSRDTGQNRKGDQS